MSELIRPRSMEPPGRTHHAPRIRASVLVLAMLMGVLQGVSTPPAAADAPNLVSHSGITVHATRWISPRILEADISTPYIAASAVAGPHRVRITLPNGYFSNTTTRYPVLYLLHGGGGANSSQWTRGGGAVEPITENAPIITVTADGGKVGWYTNWVNQSKGAQRWADFYLTQLIPFIDGNLRTVAAKDGRAIAGLSMGGYGAIRLAQDRPDLFASAASFSGAVKLNELGTKVVITEESLRHIGVLDGPFGNPLLKWSDSVEPMKRAARLKGVQVLLYAGSGINDADIMERTMGWSTHLFSQELTKAGVPHFWWMYGRPGPSVPFGCDGGHNFSCWNFALNDALPRMLSVLRTPAGWTPPPTAPPPPSAPVEEEHGTLVVNGGFEIGSTLTPWTCGGRCGRDSGGFARTGSGNAWVRHNSGWNNLYQTINVEPNKQYRLTGWIRSSANNNDGYFGVRATSGQVISEKRFGRYDGYTQVAVDFNSGSRTQVVVFAGMWAVSGDTWFQLDDVAVNVL